MSKKEKTTNKAKPHTTRLASYNPTLYTTQSEKLMTSRNQTRGSRLDDWVLDPLHSSHLPRCVSMVASPAEGLELGHVRDCPKPSMRIEVPSSHDAKETMLTYKSNEISQVSSQ